MGGLTYVYWTGARLTAWMYYVISLLDRDLFALFGVHVIVTSGIRTYDEQVSIFLSRYVTAGRINGRKVYDTRVWNGTRYYRISAAGTVAVPSTSNHEIQGTFAAVDLSDTGGDAGIGTWGSARSNWLRANAGAYDLIPEGFDFNEAWHYKVRNIFNTPPAAPAPAPVIARPIGGNMFLVFDAEAGRSVADRQYIVVTIDGGQIRGRFLEDPYERAVVVGQQPNLPVTACDSATFNGFLARIGYAYAKPIPLLDVRAAEVVPAS